MIGRGSSEFMSHGKTQVLCGQDLCRLANISKTLGYTANGHRLEVHIPSGILLLLLLPAHCYHHHSRYHYCLSVSRQSEVKLSATWC